MTGRVEEKLPNPMEGMTEEQKEYEAMKLVNMFDKLSRYEKIVCIHVCISTCVSVIYIYHRPFFECIPKATTN